MESGGAFRGNGACWGVHVWFSMELERPWPLALRAKPALGRMRSDELNAGKANPFMSKELFNYVWLITPNPSTPLTIYLSNQGSCTHLAAVCGWWWRKKKRQKERGRESKGATKQSFWRNPSRSGQKDSFLVLLAILQMHSAHEFLQTSCCKHSKVTQLLPWEISSKESVCFFVFFKLASWERKKKKKKI